MEGHLILAGSDSGDVVLMILSLYPAHWKPSPVLNGMGLGRGWGRCGGHWAISLPVLT